MRYFLAYDESVDVMESTPGGQVLGRAGTAPGSVYVRGVRVAEDDGLLFSYNVTKVDAKLRRALNRERSNVGRSAYTDRIKAILLAVREPAVLTILVDDMAGFAKGATHDEVKWNDVAERVVHQLADADPDTVFVTAGQRWSQPELIRRAEQDGKHVFVIPDALAARLRHADDDSVVTLERFARDWNRARRHRAPRSCRCSTTANAPSSTSPAMSSTSWAARASAGRWSCPRRCT